MKTFIVARDVYDRGPGPLNLELHKARSLSSFLRKQGWKNTTEFKKGNGDGCDYLSIRELVNEELKDIISLGPYGSNQEVKF